MDTKFALQFSIEAYANCQRLEGTIIYRNLTPNNMYVFSKNESLENIQSRIRHQNCLMVVVFLQIPINSSY